MAEFPAFPLWTDAYLADTGDLSTLEHGAYLLLLFAMWRAGGFLPNDDRRLARFTRMTVAKWQRTKPRLWEFFRVEGEQITQNRLLDEIKRAREKSHKAVSSARAKYRKTNNAGDANAGSKQSESSPTKSISISNPPLSPPRGARRKRYGREEILLNLSEQIKDAKNDEQARSNRSDVVGVPSEPGD